eukprot:2405854-Prorocentrum_lima.AAC.1
MIPEFWKDGTTQAALEHVGVDLNGILCFSRRWQRLSERSRRRTPIATKITARHASTRRSPSRWIGL